MEKLIEEFELRYPDWSWLARNLHGGYMTHLMSLEYRNSYGESGHHIVIYRDNPLSSFKAALNELTGEHNA